MSNGCRQSQLKAGLSQFVCVACWSCHDLSSPPAWTPSASCWPHAACAVQRSADVWLVELRVCTRRRTARRRGGAGVEQRRKWWTQTQQQVHRDVARHRHIDPPTSTLRRDVVWSLTETSTDKRSRRRKKGEITPTRIGLLVSGSVPVYNSKSTFNLFYVDKKRKSRFRIPPDSTKSIRMNYSPILRSFTVAVSVCCACASMYWGTSRTQSYCNRTWSESAAAKKETWVASSVQNRDEASRSLILRCHMHFIRGTYSVRYCSELRAGNVL